MSWESLRSRELNGEEVSWPQLTKASQAWPCSVLDEELADSSTQLGVAAADADTTVVAHDMVAHEMCTYAAERWGEPCCLAEIEMEEDLPER